MPSKFDTMRQAVALATEVEQLAESAKRALAATLEYLQHTGSPLSAKEVEAIQLTAQAELAALAVQNTVTSPGLVKVNDDPTVTEIEAEVANISDMVNANKRASVIDTGLTTDEAQFRDLLNQVASSTAETAQNALELYPTGLDRHNNPSLAYACFMSIVCARNIVECTKMLQPKPSTTKLVIAS